MVQFIGEVRRAHAEAQLLYEKTNNLFKLIKCIDSRLHIRRELRRPQPPSRDEAQIEETIEVSLDACRKCLLNVEQRLRDMVSTERKGHIATRVSQSVHFTLSADTIKRHERAIETNIQTLTTSLSLLGLLEHESNRERTVRLEQTLQQAVAHLQTISSETLSRRYSALGSPNSETLTAQRDCEAEHLGIQSLEKCIKVAQSVYSTHGSTIAPDILSLGRVEDDASSDESDAGYEIADADPQGEEIQVAGGEDPELNIGIPIADLMDDDNSPLYMVAREMDDLRKHAEKNFDTQNFSAAERPQEKAVCRGDLLERKGHRVFTDQIQMRKRLADIYMRQEKYIEAHRVITRLLSGTSATDMTPNREHASLWYLLAQAMYLNYVKHKNRSRDAAEPHLIIARRNAMKSFNMLDKLLKESDICEQDPVLLDCVDLIARIYEDQGDTVEAQTWREWLGGPSQSTAVPNAESGLLQNAQTELREKVLKQLDTRGRTRLINSIVFNLPEELQKILGSRVDLAQRCDDGLTPMMHAAACQHSGECSCVIAIRKLKDRDADVNAMVATTQETALHKAVVVGNGQTVQVLLELGADINASAPNTPLAIAVKRNQASIAKQLIEGHADICIADVDDWTLLHHAVGNNAYDALRILLHRSPNETAVINVEARSSQGTTALMSAAERAGQSRSYAFAEALINSNADINAVDSIGRSVLCFAIKGPRNADRDRFVKLLLDKGADAELAQRMMPRLARHYPILQEYIPAPRRTESVVSSSRRYSTVRTGSASTTSTSETRSAAITKKLKRSVLGLPLGKSKTR